jgi:transposase
MESRSHRDMQALKLQQEQSIPTASVTTMQNTLYKADLARRKPGWIFALTDANKEQRMAISQDYHPDKFDWHTVIFTDETPAKVGAQRGWHRSWTKTSEAYHPDVKRTRVKSASQRMVWACFTYGKKGPITLLAPEEEEEKQEAKAKLDEENAARKAAMVLHQWSHSRENKKGKTVKKRGRKPPEARIYKRNSQEGKSGIDGYRHRENVLKPLLMPFIEELKKEGREVFVLEDNAPAHRSDFDNHFFKLSDVKKMLWPANSPDANAIEHAWPWIRQHITTDFPQSTNEEELEQHWQQECANLSIEQINAWIDEIPKRIRQILEQNGDNSFHG